MKRESAAKIFNSALRGSAETAAYKCFYTFNFKDYQTEFSEAFGQLTFLNDESLSPQQSITYTPEEDTQVVLLPIIGAMHYRSAIHKEELVQSEQIKILEIKKGSPYSFNNPFDKEWINYLHIGFKSTASQTGQQSTLQNIALKKMNELVGFDFPEQMGNQPGGYIGMYEGRSEGNYRLKNPNNGLFVYIISGAFEVQGRLMEYRDGLSLWNTREIEFEALSNNAIILLLEIKLK
jgi:redox-sensitive bicupin YhaK (pirin superfamily)